MCKARHHLMCPMYQIGCARFHRFKMIVISAYTMAKYGMSMCVLGMSEEFKDDGIAVNALWPRTGKFSITGIFFQDQYFVEIEIFLICGVF